MDLIKPSYHPSAIVASPATIRQLCEVYIDDRTTSETPMTLASLTLHLGFSSIAQLRRTLDSENTPAESKHYITAAITAIEAQMSEEGLADRNNVSMAKHLLSAQHDVIPKKEVIDPTQNRVEINILGVTTANTQVNVQPPTGDNELEKLI